MNGIVDLESLLKALSPTLDNDEFVFCSIPDDLDDYYRLKPLATFREAEGTTFILSKQVAADAGLEFEGVYKMITLQVNSSLDAVGLTAAVSNKLAEAGISANMIAAYYHDHIFVQSEKAQSALEVLNELRKL